MKTITMKIILITLLLTVSPAFCILAQEAETIYSQSPIGLSKENTLVES